MDFQLVSEFEPTGDQPIAINQLVEGLKQNQKYQTLLGVTGSGKTFTIANVIERVNRPALILSHNKTLAAQLYGEFKQFFPNNRVEYFVSYYDYYQPEAYLPTTDTYIEKDLSINAELEKLRLSTTSALLSGRRDVIVVSSVSCLYGIGNPEDFHANMVSIKIGDKIGRNQLLRKFVDGLYSRNEIEFERGTFRVKGDTVNIFPAYADFAYRITFWDDEIEGLESFDPINGLTIEQLQDIVVYPANIFVTTQERIHKAIHQIQTELFAQVKFFEDSGKPVEAKRILDRVNYDLEMIKELGYCSGIENYSRFFDGRKAGTRPFCLLDYFPKDFITIIDESHVTLPQIKAMYGGDHSRKLNLIEYAFRLPAALDNRPLKFDEFEEMTTTATIYVSATPNDYEIEKSGGVIVEQVIRPTGLLDPIIEVRPSLNQIDDLLNEINLRTEKGDRTLVTTLTKRMAEELSKYLLKMGVKCSYIHSDVDTLERIQILEDLRKGLYDVLIGVNLLREGLDLPEVSLVAILDADKEGFLRSERSLVQTAGRAARNIEGKVIMYADKITDSMERTITQTNYRRAKQMQWNTDTNMVPTQIKKSADKMTGSLAGKLGQAHKAYTEPEAVDVAADPVVQYMSKKQLEKSIEDLKRSIKKAAKETDFMLAAQLRDEMYAYEKILKERFSN